MICTNENDESTYKIIILVHTRKKKNCKMMKNCENEHFHSAFSDYESFDHNSSTSDLST